MSGRRSLIKCYFWRCAGRGCDHVLGLSRGQLDPLALMLSADPLPRSEQRARLRRHCHGLRDQSASCAPPAPHRRREIIQGEGERPSGIRPMRTEARAVLTDALRDAHRWLDELTTSPNLNIHSLAAREGKTERWIRRTILLAFLCPALVKAAIDGRLPRGFGVKRLMDLPMAWPDQWSALGLRAPAER
jgi:hypothetical protein